MKALFRRHEELVDNPPVFPSVEPSNHLRVLVESTDLAERWAVERTLRQAGFGVVSCGGPALLEDGSCPLVTCGDCPGAAAADAVFFRLNLPDEANEKVLRALRREVERRPVVVEVPGPRTSRLAQLLDGCQILPMPASASEMVEALSRALGRDDGMSGPADCQLLQ